MAVKAPASSLEEETDRYLTSSGMRFFDGVYGFCEITVEIVLNCILSSLARSYPYGVFNFCYEYLPVANLARLCSSHNGFDHGIHLAGIDNHFNFDLWDKVNHILCTTVYLRMAFLAAVAPHLRNRHAPDSNFTQGLFHVVQPERFDNRFDLLHDTCPLHLYQAVAVFAVQRLIESGHFPFLIQPKPYSLFYYEADDQRANDCQDNGGAQARQLNS
jgi:hypothetical protein